MIIKETEYVYGCDECSEALYGPYVVCEEDRDDREEFFEALKEFGKDD